MAARGKVHAELEINTFCFPLYNHHTDHRITYWILQLNYHLTQALVHQFCKARSEKTLPCRKLVLSTKILIAPTPLSPHFWWMRHHMFQDYADFWTPHSNTAPFSGLSLTLASRIEESTFTTQARQGMPNSFICPKASTEHQRRFVKMWRKAQLRTRNLIENQSLEVIFYIHCYVTYYISSCLFVYPFGSAICSVLFFTGILKNILAWQLENNWLNELIKCTSKKHLKKVFLFWQNNMRGIVYISRYLGTVLGSSVISTTVMGDNQPVSTAVRFQLQHRVQVSRIPQISTLLFTK